MCLAQPDQERTRGWSRTERTDRSRVLPGVRVGVIGLSNETWNREIGYWLLVLFVFSSLRCWAGERTAALSLTSHNWLKWVFRFQILSLESFFSSASELHLSHGLSPRPHKEGWSPRSHVGHRHFGWWACMGDPLAKWSPHWLQVLDVPASPGCGSALQ